MKMRKYTIFALCMLLSASVVYAAPDSKKTRKQLEQENIDLRQKLEALEAEIAALSAEKETLEASLSSGALSGEALLAASTRHGELSALLDEKETRWLELSLI